MKASQPPSRKIAPSRVLFSASLIVTITALSLGGCATQEFGANASIERTLEKRQVGLAGSLSERCDSPNMRARIGALIAQPITPEIAARIAVANNRDLRVALAAANYAESDLIQATKLPNPEFTASTRWPSGGGPVTSTLAASFDVFDALLIPLRKQMAKDALTAAEQRAAHAALVLVGDTQIAWHRLAALEEWRTRLAAFHTEDQARIANLGQQAGILARAHAAQQEGETREDLARTDAAIVVARENLNLLMGFAERPLWRISGPEYALPLTRAEPQTLERSALASRLDLAALRTEADLVRQGHDLAEETRWSPLGIRIGVESERESNGKRVTGPTLRLCVPLFDQGQAEILRLQTAVEQADNRVASLEANIRAQVRVAAAQVDAAQNAAGTCARITFPQAAKIWNELRQTRSAQAGPLALHVARRDLIAASRREIESRFDYWRARAALSMALRG